MSRLCHNFKCPSKDNIFMKRASFFKQLMILLDVTKSNTFLQPLASSHEDLFGSFQLALYLHNFTTVVGNQSMGQMKWKNKYLLIHMHQHCSLLNLITSRNSAQCKERLQLQRKGTVVLLHIII